MCSLAYLNTLSLTTSSTYDHRVWKTGLPVRSAILKPHAGWLVVGWVTTSESQLLYVFFSPVFLICYSALTSFPLYLTPFTLFTRKFT
jgi:hypothetical protein